MCAYFWDGMLIQTAYIPLFFNATCGKILAEATRN